MASLQAIVYVSSAKRLLSAAELDALLEIIRPRNASENITGFLMYCDGNFMQYIEGPKDIVLARYHKICADPLHRDIVELINDPISNREFDGWSMAYAPIHLQTFNELAQASWQGNSEGGSGISQGQFLLRNFWAQCKNQNL